MAPTTGSASFKEAQMARAEEMRVHVRYDRGGNVIEYMRDVSRLRKNGAQVRISGRCDSACTLLLSLPSDSLCISGNATFGFHKAYGSSPDMNKWATNMMWKSYPDWVQEWLQSRGGIKNGITRMTFAKAASHLRRCDRPAGSQAVSHLE